LTLEALVHVDLDTLATALYVRVDDELKATPEISRWRPTVGITPKISDAELITLAVLQALLGYHEETRWIRYARKTLTTMFPTIPRQPGYNKRLRTLTSQLIHIIRVLGIETGLWRDPLRLADSTPVECGRSRNTAQRSDLAGWAGYGYCASHSRHFWGLRLHLITTVHGLPVAYALTNPKTDERKVLAELVVLDPDLLSHPEGLILVADKGYRDATLEQWLAEHKITLIRPAYRTEKPRPGRALLRAVRQIIESVNDTFKGQLSLEQHGGRTPTGVTVRILQRILALTAAIWHNCQTGQPVLRSLTAYDH
jgi:hypothetical protein